MATLEPGEAARGRFARWASRRGTQPRYAAYLIVSFWTVAVVVFGIVERLVDPGTFDNVWLGMWWSIQTVTTVGYGDVVPASTAGKVIASFMMLGGLSLLAIVTGAITSGFVARAQEQRREEGHDPVMRELQDVRAQLQAIRDDLAALRGSEDRT
jgi:voltage-gated potassium channel Kch